MNITKTYEKIEKYLDAHVYHIKKSDNVNGGSVYTVDGFIMYFLPDCSAWTVHIDPSGSRPLYNLYNGIFTENYRRGKTTPGKIGSRAFLRISNKPDGAYTYILKSFTKLLPAKTDYYTIPEHGGKSMVVAGSYQDNKFHVFAVIAPFLVHDDNDFIPAVTA